MKTISPHFSAKLPSIGRGLLLSVSALVACFWVAWHSLAAVSFAYPAAYRLLDIDQHISRYGPSNQYKSGFEHTSTEQHYRLFTHIVDAIQHQGKGLRDIRYNPNNNQNQQSITLLTEAEVIHLQDVADLITQFNQAAIACSLIFIGLLIYYVKQRQPPPTARQILVGTLAIMFISGTVLALVGPTHTFYWLHTQIFPDDHQWFFYYQESLMTTLMKAPDLFGLIAALWALLALALFAGLQWLLQRSLSARAKTTTR
jgi:uncharacterized membrane protein